MPEEFVSSDKVFFASIERNVNDNPPVDIVPTTQGPHGDLSFRPPGNCFSRTLSEDRQSVAIHSHPVVENAVFKYVDMSNGAYSNLDQVAGFRAPKCLALCFPDMPRTETSGDSVPVYFVTVWFTVGTPKEMLSPHGQDPSTRSLPGYVHMQ